MLLKKLIPISVKDKIKEIIRLKKLKGDIYYCPICNFSAKDMGYIGEDFPVIYEKEVIACGKRKALCYKCGSTDKERLVYLFLRDELKIFEGAYDQKNILHMAPEKNLTRLLSKLNFKIYLCGDLMLPGYSYPEYVQNMDLLGLPLEDNAFDLIIVNHVLEHIPEDMKAMEEIFRVLKNGGEAILQVPISANTRQTIEYKGEFTNKEREQLYGQFDHVRIYGQDYFEKLTSIGFIVNRISLISEKNIKSINPKEEIFYCKKSK